MKEKNLVRLCAVSSSSTLVTVGSGSASAVGSSDTEVIVSLVEVQAGLWFGSWTGEILVGIEDGEW